MFKTSLLTRVLAFSLFVTSTTLAGDAKITVTKPLQSGTVTVTIDNNGAQVDIPVAIDGNDTAAQKQSKIADELLNRGFSLQLGVDNSITIKKLAKGTKVVFDPGATGENPDRIQVLAANFGDINYFANFDPQDPFGQPAVFSAGVATELGEVIAQVDAVELGFNTSGFDVAAELWNRLAPLTPAIGADVFLNNDQLQVIFDPLAVENGGEIIFGTTSTSAGLHAMMEVTQGNLTITPVAGNVAAVNAQLFETEIERLGAGGSGNYCVYDILDSNCSDLQMGDVICVNCPSGGRCPRTAFFKVVKSDGSTECSGRWRARNSTCRSCPTGGKDGWKFK